MDDVTNTPVVTSLVVGSEPPNSTGPESAPSWKAPFLELLGLLKVTDNSQPAPKADGQRFCFVPSHDLSEISRIFLSVSTSSAQYDINLKTIRLSGSDDAPPAAIKLQEYANHVLRRIQLFRDRLFQRDVLSDSACFLLVDLFTCPICRNPLVNCVECDSKVACHKATCRGSLVIDCEQCFEHDRMVCHACLTKNDTVPPLICCPTCQGWCCREDADWCAGLVIHPALGTHELLELSRECDWDNEAIIRSHPPKPGPCRFCTHHDFAPGWAMCRNSIADMEPDRCPSQTPFMTDFHLRAAHCPECMDQSPGHRCACELGWMCDTCFAIGNKSISYPPFLTCPRCGVNYCTSPSGSCRDFIDLCRGCRGVILCKDCEEEEALPGTIHTNQELPKQVEFTAQCSFCEAWSCPDCQGPERTAVCCVCEQWFCYGCIVDPETHVISRCPICDQYVCSDCRVGHQDCLAALFTTNLPSGYMGNF